MTTDNTNSNNNFPEPQNEEKRTLSQRDKRALIFHLLYAMEGYDYQTSMESIVDNLNRGFDLDIPHDGDMVHTANQIITAREQLDEEYKPLLANWRFERVGVCTRLILRYAIWELLNTDVTDTVAINEAIELAKCYAEKDAYKFVNGILDQFVKRQAETKKES